MHRLPIRHALAAWIVVLPALALAGAAPERLLIADFEHGAQGWNYVPGWEFPGAKGSLTVDASTAHGGQRSLKLEADLTAGAYVGLWHELAGLGGRDFREIRLWVRAHHIRRIGVRINDSTDQCHQHKNVPLADTDDWQELVLKIADLVGGEHWGGANDGKWHGPAKGFGLNVGKDSFAPGPPPLGTLHVDDVELVLGPVADGHPTLLAAAIDPPACRPGFATRITYRWEAEPLGRDFEAFVHFLGPDGRMAFQADHLPEPPTAVWSGHVEYARKVLVPIDTPPGAYRVVLGLYDRRAAARGWDRPRLATGSGVIAERGPDGQPDHAYQVGTLQVDAAAALPKLPPPTLNLDGYRMTFHDEFDDLSVSVAGPETRWFTGTKGNFGDARFMEQKDGFPFSVDQGLLRIAAQRRNGRWCGGILASVDKQGRGFAQQYGYFEMRAKFPASRGMWPAFWLLGQNRLTDKHCTEIEIDVVEHYGVMPNAVHTTLHQWYANGKHWAQANDVFDVPGLTDAFHNYGVLVDAAHVTWYFDGIEIGRQKTPDSAKVPVYLLVDLAMGGGWPIQQAVSPSYMYVDYVRAYAK